MKIPRQKIIMVIIVIVGLTFWLRIFPTNDPHLVRFVETSNLLRDFRYYVNRIELTYNGNTFLFYGDILPHVKDFLNPDYSGRFSLQTETIEHIIADESNILVSIRYYADNTHLFTANIMKGNFRFIIQEYFILSHIFSTKYSHAMNDAILVIEQTCAIGTIRSDFFDIDYIISRAVL